MFSDKIYNSAPALHWHWLARARTDAGLKLLQINHGSLTQEEEVASWGGISEEQTILADNRHGAS